MYYAGYDRWLIHCSHLSNFGFGPGFWKTGPCSLLTVLQAPFQESTLPTRGFSDAEVPRRFPCNLEGWQSWCIKEKPSTKRWLLTGKCFSFSPSSSTSISVSLVHQKEICETKFIRNHGMLLPYHSISNTELLAMLP